MQHFCFLLFLYSRGLKDPFPLLARGNLIFRVLVTQLLNKHNGILMGNDLNAF